jgi:hypothetical protein
VVGKPPGLMREQAGDALVRPCVGGTLALTGQLISIGASCWVREALVIQNFDQVRAQLKDLAEVLNSYKSEAVQLRLVELIFDGTSRKPASGVTGNADPAPPAAATQRRPTARKRVARKKAAEGDSSGAPKQRSANSKKGTKATLTDLYGDGFFKTPRTIGQVVEHCDHNMALKFKSSDFSGPLARYTREKRLKRVKNGEGQYEYTQAG